MTTTTHPNLELFERALAAFAAGDMPSLEKFFDEDVTWHYPGTSPLAGDHVGRDATFRMFAGEFERSQGTLAPRLHDAVATDTTVAALLHSTAHRDDKTLDQDVVLTFCIRDGRFCEAWTVWTDLTEADDFWT